MGEKMSSKILYPENWGDTEDEIAGTPVIKYRQFGHRLEEDEMQYVFLSVQGNDRLGYIAFLDEMFSKENAKIEYFRTLFASVVCGSVEEAEYSVWAEALETTKEEGYIQDIQ